MKIIILLFALLALTACQEQEKQDYKIAEVLNVSCDSNDDCTTPDSYLIRSSCPYTTRCIESRCTVICEWWE